MKKAIMVGCLFMISVFAYSQKLIEAVESKDYEAVKKYIAEGEKVNKPNKKGLFPLWNAVWNNDIEMVNLLLKNGADPKQRFKGKEGELNCLDIASQEGFLEIAQSLVNAGADIDDRSFRGHTPLRIATRNGRIELVKYFISQGAEIDTRGEDGATPLEAAASKGHIEIVKLLVEKGAYIDNQDKDGDFPLGEAARAGFREVVVYLLSKGADISLKNKEGNTAEDLAKLAGQASIETLLKEAKKKQ